MTSAWVKINPNGAALCQIGATFHPFDVQIKCSKDFAIPFYDANFVSVSWKPE
jgi:hypothetical protein